MAHVLILREAPSFTQGEKLFQGTHEIVEANISKRLYQLNKARKGYNAITSSEFKFIWYRMKRENIPEFIRDLGVINLNPKELPKGFWKGLLFNSKIEGKMEQFGFGRIQLLIMALLRFVPLLKGYDKKEGQPNPFNKTADNRFWCYNFFIGVIEDIDKGMGEEL